MRNMEAFAEKVVLEVRPRLFDEREGTIPGFKVLVDEKSSEEDGGSAQGSGRAEV